MRSFFLDIFVANLRLFVKCLCIAMRNLCGSSHGDTFFFWFFLFMCLPFVLAPDPDTVLPKFDGSSSTFHSFLAAFGAYLATRAFTLIQFFELSVTKPGPSASAEVKQEFAKGNAGLYGYLYQALPARLQTHAATHFRFDGMGLLRDLQKKFGASEKRDLTQILRDLSQPAVKSDAKASLQSLDVQF